MADITNAEMVEIIKEAKANARKGLVTKITDKKNLTTEDKFKMSLCRLFVRYANQHRLTTTEMHKLTGIEMSRLSEILHYKVKKFTIDRLLIYLNVLAKHSNRIKAHVQLLEQAMNLPVQTLQDTKKMCKEMKNIIKPAFNKK